MAGINPFVRDEGGQWILLSGLIIAVGLVVLSILLNQAMMAGGRSPEAILKFPKDDIREFRWEVHRWAHHNVSRLSDGAYISNLTNQTMLLYGSRGISVNLSVLDVNATNQTANLTLFITDGPTTCNFRREYVDCIHESI
ncbi:MAG: hypothetical protein CW694_03145 [Candidatus Syntrophoarchaeum sp. WYZ-LMO15]|nr:MAG: hypothetical protein CW694_03145 [Candidatus Syntrophoarchaeum sp. WYZ-LMO15]